jgi:pimeloyl-ACP methyl ester carboxylesterase
VGSESYVTVDQARLWTARAGEGEPLVLCHGGPGLCDDLAPVSALVEDVETVYRFDRRAGDHIAVLRCPACGDTFPTDAAGAAPCPTCGGRRAELASEPLL